MHFEKIKKIKFVGIEDVYDFETENKNYICNDIVVHNSSFSLKDTFTEFEQAKEFYKKYPEQCKIAEALEGKIRHVSQHACGTIISNKPFEDFCPIMRITGEICTEWEKNQLEELGYVKFDILGLKTLTVISDTLKEIEKNHGIKVELPKTYDDKKIYDTVFKEGKTLGIFQFETVANQKLCQQMSIDRFNLLVDCATLGKPGTLHSGQTAEYVLRLQGKKPIEYAHPLLEPITKDTYGIILYQESVMQIMFDIGKFSWATAESTRKIMSKSKGKEVFGKLRKEFCDNALREHKMSLEDSGKIFDNVSMFGSYSLNRSHAFEYALIGYYTAFLKTYYPLQFFKSLLVHENDSNMESQYILEARKFGIDVLNPSINKSEAVYKIADGKIRMGFKNIKGIGEVQVKKILKGHPYVSIADYCKRAKPSISVFKALIMSGAFDEFNTNMRELFENSEVLLKGKGEFQEIADWEEKIKVSKQMAFINLPPEKPLIDFFEDPFAEKINYEKIKDLQFDDYIQERWIKGIISYLNLKTEGMEGNWAMFENVLERRYAHLNIFDGTGNILVHLSPEQYTYYKKILERVEGVPVIIKGHSIPNYQKIYCDALIVLDEIDFNNPIIKFLDNKRVQEITQIALKMNEKVGVIETVSYKVSKNKKPYARINFVGQTHEQSCLCFRLDSDIFVAGEIVIYKQPKSPFIDIVRRIK